MSTLAPSEAAPLRSVPAHAPARADDEAPGFDALYRRYFRFTWSVLRRLGVPQAAIEDAAQEVWVIVHRRLDALESPRAARSWLFQIARRVAARHRRGEQRSRRKLDALGWVPTRPELPHAERDTLLTAETLLGQLDERKREAFVLSELEGWSAPEIAKAAGTNPNTVYSRIRLAREELRAGWEARCPDTDLDLALADLRDRTRPPKGAAKRCWVALVPKLALGAEATVTGVGAAASAAVTWKLALAGAAVIGLAAVGGSYIGGHRSASATAKAAARASASEAPREHGGAEQASARAGTPPASPAAASPATAALAPTSDADAATPTAAHVPTEAAPRSDPTPSARPRRASASPSAASDDVDDETGLLTAAQTSLAAGEPARALAQLDAHRERFAASPLADLRALLEVKALCAAGRKAEAAAARVRAEEAMPGSALLPKMRRACAP